MFQRFKNFRKLRKWYVVKLKLVDARLYFVSIFVGLLTGLVAVPYHYCLYYFFNLRSEFFASRPDWYWHIPLFLFFWAVLIFVSWLVMKMPLITGGGIPQTRAAINGRITYKHYGKYVERMIHNLAGERNPQAVARTVDNLARYMRTKSYEYNQEHPNNEVIVKDIKRMSGGAIQIDEVALNNLRSDYKQPFSSRPQKGAQQHRQPHQQQRQQKNRNQQPYRNFTKNNGQHRNSSK